MKNRTRFQKPTRAGTPLASPQKPNGNSTNEVSLPAVTKSIQTRRVVTPTPDQVSALAYRIYLREGRPQGRDMQHWLEAEAQLAVVPPLTIKTEMTVKTETTVKNEVG